MHSANSPQPEQPVWLVVEDDFHLRNMIIVMMTMWGVTPFALSDGHETTRWLDQVERGEVEEPLPELALLDIRVPGPRGHELAYRMRQIPALRTIPMVLMTAHYFTSDQAAALKQATGAQRVIAKPLPDANEFYQILLETVKSHREIANATSRFRAALPFTLNNGPFTAPNQR